MPKGYFRDRIPRKWRFAFRVSLLLAKGLSLIFVVLILLFAAAAYFVLPKFANSERAKGILVEKMEDFFHRPVSIDDVILAPQGIKLRGISVENRAEPGQYLLSGNSAVVTIRLLPLLRRRLQIGTIRLISPEILLVRTPQGRWAFEDIFKSSGPGRPAQEFFASLPLSLAADKIMVEDGVVHIDDELRGSSTTFRNLNLLVRKPDLSAPFHFSASFNTLSRLKGREIQASCSASGVVSLASMDWASSYLHASDVSLTVGGVSLRGFAGLSNFHRPVLSGEFRVPRLSRARLQAFWGKPVPFPAPASRWRFNVLWTARGHLAVQSLRADAGALSLSGTGAVDFSSSPFTLQADLNLAEFPLDQLSGLMPETGRYRLEGFLDASAGVAGAFSKLSVSRARVSVRGFGGRFGRARVGADAATLSASRDFSKLYASVARGSVSAFGQSFSEVALNASLVRRRLSVPRLSFRWDGSRAVLSGSLSDVADPRKIALRASVDRLRWENVQKLVTDVAAAQVHKSTAAATPSFHLHWVEAFKYKIPKHFPDTVGRVRIGLVRHKDFWFKNASFLWDLKDITPHLNRARGDVRVSFGPGRVNDIQALQESNKFLRVVFLPYLYMHKMNSFSVLSAATAYPNTLDFNRIEGQYAVRRGVVDTRFFHVDSPQLLAFAAGAADFGRETVDMQVLTRLTSYRAPLPEWWVDELGRPAIGFWVKGDLNKPTLEPMLHKMAADEIEKTLAQAKAQAAGRLKSAEAMRGF